MLSTAVCPLTGPHPISCIEGLKRTKRPAYPSKREFSRKLPVDFMCTISSPRSPACGPTVQNFNLPASIIISANSS